MQRNPMIKILLLHQTRPSLYEKSLKQLNHKQLSMNLKLLKIIVQKLLPNQALYKLQTHQKPYLNQTLTPYLILFQKSTTKHTLKQTPFQLNPLLNHYRNQPLRVTKNNVLSQILTLTHWFCHSQKPQPHKIP